jgi:hypothetical protein
VVLLKGLVLKLLERIKNAIATGKVDYWGSRPENLSRSDFDAFVGNNPTFRVMLDDRQSGDGDHGLDGEDYVYKGIATVTRFGKTRKFYVKFYFWKKGESHEEQGITVQSFKASDVEIPQNLK